MENMTDPSTCRHVVSLSEPPPEIAATMSVLGGKWKMLILWQLMGRPCRFNELRRAITGVSQHMLTVQLRDLESQGVITRTIFAEVPPRVEYALSEHGKSLAGVMRSLTEWGISHLARQRW
jgi:DNA-binding HxlR family transcriptional regulator